MATQTEIVKARLGAGTKVRARAAVTTDARTGPASIDEVVMTQYAVHLAMFVVREVQDQRLTAANERLTERESGATVRHRHQRHQHQQRDERTEDD